MLAWQAAASHIRIDIYQTIGGRLNRSRGRVDVRSCEYRQSGRLRVPSLIESTEMIGKTIGRETIGCPSRRFRTSRFVPKLSHVRWSSCAARSRPAVLPDRQFRHPSGRQRPTCPGGLRAVALDARGAVTPQVEDIACCAREGSSPTSVRNTTWPAGRTTDPGAALPTRNRYRGSQGLVRRTDRSHARRTSTIEKIIVPLGSGQCETGRQIAPGRTYEATVVRPRSASRMPLVTSFPVKINGQANTVRGMRSASHIANAPTQGDTPTFSASH